MPLMTPSRRDCMAQGLPALCQCCCEAAASQSWQADCIWTVNLWPASLMPSRADMVVDDFQGLHGVLAQACMMCPAGGPQSGLQCHLQ